MLFVMCCNFSNSVAGGGKVEEDHLRGDSEEEEEEITTEEAEEVDEMSFKAESLLRETITSVHRATTSPNASVRLAALQSLETMTPECPLLVLQTWLDQFARTNGGSAPADYVASDRVHFLSALAKIVEAVIDLLDYSHPGQRACVDRIVSLATEEMTRQPDVIPNVQKPCSVVLVRLSERFVGRVMEALLGKFQPGVSVHYYVVVTLSRVAQANATGFVPFLKGILGTMVANMKSVKKDNIRYAYADALSRFSEALLEYLTNIASTPDTSVTKEHFVKELDLAHEIMFSSWLSKGDVKVRQSVLEALGQMAGLLSFERVSKHVGQIITVLVSTYKRVPEPYFVTQCISQLIDAIIEREQSAILDPMIEPLLTALFTQVSHTSAAPADYSKPFSMKNHHEVLRCYDVLVKSHKEKLIAGLVVRMSSVDENIRLASLTIFKHLMSSSIDQFEDRMPDVFKAMHSKLNDPSNKVKKMLAQLTAQLGRLGFLKGSEGKDFLEFIIRLCALSCDEEMAISDNKGVDSVPSDVVSNRGLKEMCDSILLLLSTSVDAMEPVLWPHLMDYLLAPEFGAAIPSVVKSLNALIVKKRADEDDDVSSPSNADFMIDYAQFKFVQGPYALLSRLLVLAAVPFPGCRGASILAFLQNFAPNINKHIPPLWKQRIPLLQHYLETHHLISSASGIGVASPSWDQDQWEDWLLALLDDTVKEIDLDEWTVALAGAMSQQLSLYGGDQVGEKCFLMRCLGKVLKSTNSRTLVLDRLGAVFSATNHAEERQQVACAKAFGNCAATHLALVLDKLEILLKAGAQKKSSSFFGLLKDNKIQEEQLQARCTILFCVGQASARASKTDLKAKVNQITVKFVMPGLKSAITVLRLAALRAMTDLAAAVQSDKMWASEDETRLASQGDLIHEAIACLKDETWSVANKQVALGTTLELIRIRPFIAQSTRCSLLKACFTAVFPGLVAHNRHKEENYSNVSRSEGHLKQMVDKLQILVQELLKQEMEQSTLDEIFTLLEMWLRKECAVAREMAINILRTCLETYLQNVEFKVGTPTSFSPGPYIIGAVVPRCFDSSRSVQNLALQCLQITVRILSAFEGHDRENVEEALSKLKSLSAMSPSNGNEPVASSLVSRTASEILRERVTHAQLLPLLHSLIDALLDEILCSARGASMVLCSVVEARGSEMYTHVADLVADKIHAKLVVLDDSETRVRTLTCAKILASFNPRDTANTMLNQHRLPLDEAAESIWKVITQEVSLADKVMRYLLEMISTPSASLYTSDEKEHLSQRRIRLAKHAPLAAIIALGTMCEMKEMEAICDGEFDTVFVPLLTAMGAYMGIRAVQPVSRPRRESIRPSSSPEKNKLMQRSKTDLETVTRNRTPFASARATLRAFLNCKGCRSVAAIVEDGFARGDGLGGGQVQVYAFADELVAPLVQSVILDFPQLLPKLLAGFQPYLGEGAVASNRLAAVAFSAQLAQTDSATIDAPLVEKAIENLLTSLRWNKDIVENVTSGNEVEGDEEVNVKVLCLRSLAAYKLRQNDDQREVKNYGSIILDAFLEVVGGEDLKSDLNHTALVGLSALFEGGHLYEADVHRVITEVSNKVRPFFDCGQDRDRAAAIKCFCQLSDFATSEYKAVFADRVHSALVSLVLHANNGVAETNKVSREGLAKVLGVILASDREHLVKHLRSGANFNFAGFLKDLCAALCNEPACKELFPTYASRALGYFKSPSPHLRSSSVLLVTLIVLTSDDQMLEDLGDDEADAICRGMSALVAGDKSVFVQEAAALNVGKVFVYFRQRNRARNNKAANIASSSIVTENGMIRSNCDD
jgi:hypothetical protein